MIVLNIAWLLGLLVAWVALAGQSGSPMPDNWPLLDRILDIVGWSILASLALPLLAAMGLLVVSDRARLAGMYGAALLLLAGVTLALSLPLWQQARMPATPPVAMYRDPCFRFGPHMAAVDAFPAHRQGYRRTL